MSRLSQRRQMYRRQLAEVWIRAHQPQVWQALQKSADMLATRSTDLKESKRGRDTTDRRES